MCPCITPAQSPRPKPGILGFGLLDASTGLDHLGNVLFLTPDEVSQNPADGWQRQKLLPTRASETQSQAQFLVKQSFMWSNAAKGRFTLNRKLILALLNYIKYNHLYDITTLMSPFF